VHQVLVLLRRPLKETERRRRPRTGPGRDPEFEGLILVRGLDLEASLSPQCGRILRPAEETLREAASHLLGLPREP
jgi:hypothetical protein